MNQVQLYVFDVDHGLCASILDSNRNLLVIDCGRKSKFSPIKYLASTLGVDIIQLEIGLIILSHFHGDHIADIHNLVRANVQNKIAPELHEFESDDVPNGNSIEGVARIDFFLEAYSHFTRESYNPPQWLFDLKVHRLSPSLARQLPNSNVLNDSSYVAIVTFSGYKFIFPGDIQTDGMLQLLENQQFVTDAMSPTIIIAPHHGHRSSYCSELYQCIDRPLVHVCSLARNDEHLASQYSTDAASVGGIINGERRKMLSTRSDGTLLFTLSGGHYSIESAHLPANDF